MNYPERQILTSLITAIGTATGRTVLTIPPKDVSYPYIYLSQGYMSEVGNKGNYIYSYEFLIQVLHKDLHGIDLLLNDMEDILGLFKKGNDFTISGYSVISTEVISVNRMSELYESFRLEIGLIRAKIDLM